MRSGLFLLFLCLASSILLAQNSRQLQDLTLDPTARVQVIERALKALNENYVFPDVAQKMEQVVRARQQRGEYDRVTSGRQLAQMLTDHLRDVSRDRHLSVDYSPQVLPPEPPVQPPDTRPSPEV